MKPPSKREQKRLEAAEHVCRCFRKGLAHNATQQLYFNLALDWLQVWIKNAPKRVQYADMIPVPGKRNI